MNGVININSYKVDRKKYSFNSKSVVLNDEYGKKTLYPCVVLIEINTKRVVSFTGLERYIIDINRSETSNIIAISRVKSFLNYILHNTHINSLNELTLKEIRDFLMFTRVKKNGEEKKSLTWIKTQNEVYDFLINYYENNKNICDFGYSDKELRNKTDYENFRRKYGPKCKELNNDNLKVKPPKKNDNKRRKRTIMYGHLKALLYTAKKYDPMIYFAIILMAYAGLREGSVVNLSFGDIKIHRVMGVVDEISLNLLESDKFRKGKSHKGVIKKIRVQGVYPDFLEDVIEAFEYHKGYLKALGLSTDEKSPIFYNKWKDAMSVKTLMSRIHSLFDDYFLKILEETSEHTVFEGETLAFIEQYKDEYPGAHMFRHWFTMYLISKKDERPEMVRKWRGDSENSDSYEQYLHFNKDLLDAYRKTTYSFQESLIEDIYD